MSIMAGDALANGIDVNVVRRILNAAGYWIKAL